MKRAMIFAAALMSAGAFGCSSNKSSGIPVNSSVADISAPAPSPAPMQVQPVAQPVVYDTMTTQTPANGAVGAMNSGSYTVKRGDTLYSIARSRYGDGKQWKKIASANPGVRPETLKVGQTITIP